MVWTPEQTGLFLDFVADDRHYALWHLIAFRGLRRGEACSLNRSELSLTRGTVTVRTGEIDEPTKNQRSRTLGLDKATIDVLKANRRQQLQQQELLGDLYEDNGLVFTDELGRPLNLTTVSPGIQITADTYTTLFQEVSTAARSNQKPELPQRQWARPDSNRRHPRCKRHNPLLAGVSAGRRVASTQVSEPCGVARSAACQGVPNRSCAPCAHHKIPAGELIRGVLSTGWAPECRHGAPEGAGTVARPGRPEDGP
jgi:integrase